MTKFLSQIVLGLALVAICDIGLGLFLDYLRDHAPDGRYYKATYSLEHCNEDVIIIGSSKGESNYVPYIIEDSLHMTCWNASRGGQGLPYFRAIQEGILARYHPKVVLLNLEPDILERAPKYEKAGFLRPYYSQVESIQPIINRISPFESIMDKSRLIEYNSSFYYLLRPYLKLGLDGRNDQKGWKPRQGTIKPERRKEILDILDHADQLVDVNIRDFDQLLLNFRNAGVQVYMIVSPDYGEVTKYSETMNYLRRISTSQNIPLIDYSNNRSISSNPKMFVDIQHLNEAGALHFTRSIMKTIRIDLDSKTISYASPGTDDL